MQTRNNFPPLPLFITPDGNDKVQANHIIHTSPPTGDSSS